jgi:hypothetical protein
MTVAGSIVVSDLYRLIYVSAAREEMSPAELDSILSVARKNNSPVGVTGLLLYHQGSFFQVLEGPKESVGHIFSAIEADTRHSGVIVLEARISSARVFPNWSMGYVKAHNLRSDQQANLVDLSNLVGRGEPAQLSSSPAVSLQINTFLSSFREFAEI